MNDTKGIQPALTEAEFDVLQDALNEGYTAEGAIAAFSARREWAKVASIANHALPDDDPRKIVRADVDELLGVAADMDASTRGRDGDSLRMLAARLAALLPPNG